MKYSWAGLGGQRYTKWPFILERIMEIIAKKQDEDLQGKSIEELQAMLEN